MMVKEARYVDDAANGPLPLYESQSVALKATSSKEALPSKVAQLEAIGLNEDEMVLIIKRFKTALKGRKEYPNKNKLRGKRSCYKCGKSGHFIAQCPDNDNDQAQEKKGKKERKKNYRKAKGEAHIGKEWDSDCSSSDSDDEGLAALAFKKSSLFPNERHTCFMAKEKKVHIWDTPKYTSSSDEESSDDEVDYSDLFKWLDRTKVDKINELIDALNEKDRLLEHVVIFNRCNDFNIDVCNEHISTILKLNNDVASLNAQLKTCKDNYEKLKLARDAYTIGRHPSIKDGLGFQKETKNLTSQRTSNLNKEKGKPPMASSTKRNHAYL
jgi:hypothetical protein